MPSSHSIQSIDANQPISHNRKQKQYVKSNSQTILSKVKKSLHLAKTHTAQPQSSNILKQIPRPSLP